MDQPISTCLPFYTLFLFFFFSPFSYFDSPPTLFYSFLMLAHVVLWRWWCCDSLLVVAIVLVMILCTTRALYILLVVTDFIILAFNHFVWFRVLLPTTHQFVSCPATTTYLCWLCHSPLPDKENYFICLLTVAFSPTIPHDIYLVVSTHPSFFWVVCHPNKISPPKEYEQEPQNRLSILPSTRSYPLLPPTHDPPLLYWLDTGQWCLGLTRAPLPMYAKSLSIVHAPTTIWRLVYAFYCSSLTSYGMNCFLIFHSLLAFFFQGLNLA